jgi:Tol biopolymer transport system component
VALGLLVLAGAIGLNPTVSAQADDSMIAFVARGPDDIYLIRPDGTGLTNLTHDPQYETAVAWSPDGRELVYLRGSTVYVIRRDGSRARGRLERG